MGISVAISRSSLGGVGVWGGPGLGSLLAKPEVPYPRSRNRVFDDANPHEKGVLVLLGVARDHGDAHRDPQLPVLPEGWPVSLPPLRPSVSPPERRPA